MSELEQGSIKDHGHLRPDQIPEDGYYPCSRGKMNLLSWKEWMRDR